MSEVVCAVFNPIDFVHLRKIHPLGAHRHSGQRELLQSNRSLLKKKKKHHLHANELLGTFENQICALREHKILCYISETIFKIVFQNLVHYKINK